MRRRPRLIAYVITGCLSIALLFYVLLIRKVEIEDSSPTAFGLHGKRPIKPSIQERLTALENDLASSRNAVKSVRQRLLDSSRRHQENEDRDRFSPIQSNTCSFDSVDRIPGITSVEEIYQQIPFDNPDGGSWKQGWDVQIEEERRLGRKLKVFVVPHSHNDPGWLKTFEGYFKGQTKHILDNMLKFLSDHPSMKFIWAETSYFAYWWETISSEEDKDKVRKLLEDGQLEIVTGGWVMNDEANTHIYAMILQLMEGHEWLKKHLGYTPRYGWAIDPFGLSPSMAFILERAGFDGMVIQRVHYAIKKYLAKHKQLEFKWKQDWQVKHFQSSDKTTRTQDQGITCHVMPFYSYDIPHSCGPDPKVCCQFDFRRLPPFKLTCPWKVNPTLITDYNVEERARKLADQYWKKAMLYRSNAVMIPLGDDFRFEKLKEWSLQFDNYQRLFDFMNNSPDLNIEAKFGTLADYFDYIKQDQQMDSKSLPSLTGDFFTYSDVDDHYWSGYFTSRPFYKRFDRLLDYFLRSTDILFSIASLQNLPVSSSSDHRQKLEYVRQSLALFQHHDAITGTARDAVVNDYAQRMFRSIVFTQEIMETVLNEMEGLTTTKSSKTQLELLHVFPDKDSLPMKKVILLEEDSQVYLVVFNSLTHSRKELICIETSLNSSGCSIIDVQSGSSLPVQTRFIWEGTRIMTDRLLNCFLPELKPLSLTSFIIRGRTKTDEDSFSHSTLYNFRRDISIPKNEFVSKGNPSETIAVESDIMRVIIDTNSGMVNKVIQLDEFGLSQTHDFSLDFVTYGTLTTKGKTKSGAYLFMPDSNEAQSIQMKQPQIIISKGPLFSQIEVLFNEPLYLKYVITLVNGEPFLRIDNEFHITKGSYISNKELVMRLTSHVENKNAFFTDLNGLQMMKRQRLDKVPFQGNVYPVSSMAYIEDKITRLSILSAQPLGGISPKEGVLDIFQDRRLLQDDNRGLGQGVTDNRKTRLHFKIMFEIKPLNNLKPTLKASQTLYQLLHPPLSFLSREVQTNDLNFLNQDLPCDHHLLSMRSSLRTNEIFVTLHRFGVSCGTGCDVNSGFNFDELLSSKVTERLEKTMSRKTLTALYDLKSNISMKEMLYIDQMDLATYSLWPKK